MGFDNKYPNRKDWRRPYYGSAAFDISCRPGGDCPQCRQEKKLKAERKRVRKELLTEQVQ